MKGLNEVEEVEIQDGLLNLVEIFILVPLEALIEHVEQLKDDRELVHVDQSDGHEVQELH